MMEYVQRLVDNEQVQEVVRKGRFLLRKYIKGNEVAFRAARNILQDHTGIADENVLIIIALALITFLVGVFFFLFGFFSKRSAGKESSKDNVASSPNKPASLLKVFTSVDDDHKGDLSVTAPLLPGQSSPAAFSFDDFMIKLHKHPILVQRHKDGEKKTRCMRISHNCDLKLYKMYHVSSGDIIPVGSGYIKIPLLELKDCFIVADKSGFIMEFKSRTLLFSGPIGMETKQLVKGFRILLERLKDDRRYLEVWKTKFAQNCNTSVASPQPHSSTPTRTADRSPAGLEERSPLSGNSSYYQFGKKK
eukprot:gene34147-41335_t